MLIRIFVTILAGTTVFGCCPTRTEQRNMIELHITLSRFSEAPSFTLSETQLPYDNAIAALNRRFSDKQDRIVKIVVTSRDKQLNSVQEEFMKELQKIAKQQQVVLEFNAP